MEDSTGGNGCVAEIVEALVQEEEVEESAVAGLAGSVAGAEGMAAVVVDLALAGPWKVFLLAAHSIVQDTSVQSSIPPAQKLVRPRDGEEGSEGRQRKISTRFCALGGTIYDLHPKFFIM